MIRQYLQITKPKIIFSNLISVCGGFLLASKGSIDCFLFLKTLFSVFLIVASSCIFNNIIDRDIDVKMERTQNRVLVTGLMSTHISFVYASLLGITGFIFLYFELNSLVTLLGIVGFTVYVGIYSLYMKRNSVYGILIGSISGAIPPVIGYCTVTNKFDKCAMILLIIFSLWQIPHSYAIAILRFNDYQLAEIPVLPVVKGIPVTKNHILFYILSFTIASLMLTVEGYTGYEYLIVTAVVNFCWFFLALIGLGYKPLNDKVWAYKLFIFSIFVITVLSMMMSIDFIIPSFLR